MGSFADLHFSSNSQLPAKNAPKAALNFGWGRRQLILMATLLLLGLGGGLQRATAQKLWESGDEVLRIQFRLQALGYSYVEPTGVYDLNTQRAVMDFQQRSGLDADGVVGRQTRPVLFDTFDPIVGASESYSPLPSLSSPSSPSLAFPPEGATYPQPSSPEPALERGSFDPVAVNPSTIGSRALRFGDRGEEVRALQFRLQQLGYYFDNIDGIYGSNTQDAVARFQRDRGLFIDGIANSQTLDALGLSSLDSRDVALRAGSRGLQRGDRGEEVRALQIRLRQLGYYFGDIDGIYGVNTERAVTQFQLAEGRFPNGIADSQTLEALGLPSLPDSREGSYVVVVPGGEEMLRRVRPYADNAHLLDSRRGRFVNAGRFNNRNDAESLSYYLRARGFDARVSHNP